MKIILSEEQLVKALKLYTQALTGYDMTGATYTISKESNKYEVKVELKDDPQLPEPTLKPRQVQQQEVEQIYAPIAKRTPDVS